MTPAGTLDLVGIAAQVLHGRQLLDQVGIQAELLQVGKYGLLSGASATAVVDSVSPTANLRQRSAPALRLGSHSFSSSARTTAPGQLQQVPSEGHRRSFVPGQ
jgi:hypothetical protein